MVTETATPTLPYPPPPLFMDETPLWGFSIVHCSGVGMGVGGGGGGQWPPNNQT